ncbi:MAG: SDR family NAD(P)-dependent oxidoreductase [Eubacterium sp.]|nr:SDR family NAD(P)-dependent oxidoreductase [Eubacterium sp.]
MKEPEYKKKVALVTGASRGIGAAAAAAFARKGFTVLACARSAEGLERLKTETGCHVLQGDIGSEAFVREFFSHARKLGSPAVLVNNAAVSYTGVLQDLSLDEWNEIVRINLTSVFLTCREIIPDFLSAGGGSIVNVSSVWGENGASCECAYAATKGGVNAFTRSLAKELAPSGIRVNAAGFGFIDTDMNAHLLIEEKEMLKQEIPAGRFGSAEEAAALITDLALRHPYMTGQIVTLDGGWCV